MSHLPACPRHCLGTLDGSLMGRSQQILSQKKRYKDQQAQLGRNTVKKTDRCANTVHDLKWHVKRCVTARLRHFTSLLYWTEDLLILT